MLIIKIKNILYATNLGLNSATDAVRFCGKCLRPKGKIRQRPAIVRKRGRVLGTVDGACDPENPL
jgi:hypothetical protein